MSDRWSVIHRDRLRRPALDEDASLVQASGEIDWRSMDDEYPSPDYLSLAVAEWLDAGGNPRLLAAYCECAVSTVDRWARGVSVPARHVRRMIMTWLSVIQ